MITRVIKAGNILLILVLGICVNAKAQCPNIKDLIDLYDGQSVHTELGFNYSGASQSIKYKGYVMTVRNSFYEDGNLNSSLNILPNQLVFLTISNNNCFSKVKAQVAKEVGLKVGTKKSEQINDLTIESYDHLSRDLSFEFVKSSTNSTYEIYVISKEYQRVLIETILVQKQIEAADKMVEDRIALARECINSKKFSETEAQIREAKKIISNYRVSEKSKANIKSIENELSSALYQDVRAEIYQLMAVNLFYQARKRMNELKNKNSDFYDKLKGIENDLISRAANFYMEQSSIRKGKKEFTTALTYIDSVLIFEPSNSNANNQKIELNKIILFLHERANSNFDYWASYPMMRKDIFENYKLKTYKEMSLKREGEISYTLEVKTDTNCNVLPSITWNTKPLESIAFSYNELNNYNLEPYRKYDFCANSVGSLSFRAKWSNTSHKAKCIEGSFNYKKFVETKVKNEIENKYSYINGKVGYNVNDIQFNNEKVTQITIDKFKTRGPLNAVCSIVLPGTGLMRVTYGKKGYTPMILFVGGVSALLYSSDSYVVSGAALCLATSYIWDITGTLVNGSRNLKYSKGLRSRLKGGQTIML